MNEIKIVIGSWGSYNECNARALGSKWLDLSDYSDWEEIEEELKNEGFELNGIDEELFIQDVEGIPTSCVNWDYVHPKRLFELLIEADVIKNDYKQEVFKAFVEVEGFHTFENRVERRGSNWDDDVYLYENFSWEDYGRHMVEVCGIKIPEELENYIDFEEYGESFRFDGVSEYSNGLIEVFD